MGAAFDMMKRRQHVKMEEQQDMDHSDTLHLDHAGNHPIDHAGQNQIDQAGSRLLVVRDLLHYLSGLAGGLGEEIGRAHV